MTRGRHLLFPLITVGGAGGGLLLIASTFVSSHFLVLLIPYLLILSCISVYIRSKHKIVMGLKHEMLSIVAVYMLMSLVLYSYIQATGFHLQLPSLYLGIAALSAVMVCFAAIIVYRYFSQKKRSLSAR